MRLVVAAMLVAGCGVTPIAAVDGGNASPDLSPRAPSCFDGVLDNSESDVDCGGGLCEGCAFGRACRWNQDCGSGACVRGRCASPTCVDGALDGDESDIDCGGSCAACATDQLCRDDTDCQADAGLVCDSAHRCVARCNDGVRDGEESDIDCGGPVCSACAAGGACRSPFDCSGKLECESGVCTDPCTDGIRNVEETDVDCGGPLCSACADRLACNQDIDCHSLICSGGVCVPQPGAPDFGVTVSAAVPPPPLSGGTLAILADGRTAFASDPDRDQLYVVDLVAAKVRFTIALLTGDEPGRVVQDAQGIVHVALRRGGAIVDVDPVKGVVISRRAVCGAPRGIAFDALVNSIDVACASGELVSLPAAGGPPTRTLLLDRDLRDVVATDGVLYVSRFATAELIEVSRDGVRIQTGRPGGEVLGTIEGTTPTIRNADIFAATQAWRTIARPGGGVLMLHQKADTMSVMLPQSQPGSDESEYGGFSSSSGGFDPNPCKASIVFGAVTHFFPGMVPQVDVLGAITDGVLPVDLALSPSGNTLVVLAAGNAHTTSPTVIVGPGTAQFAGCPTPLTTIDGAPFTQPTGEPIAIAFDGAGRLVVQSREPASLQIVSGAPAIIPLSSISRSDTGYSLFHTTSGQRIACASCHGEGGEDGHVWILPEGTRRTQPLRGGVAASAPFHWSGDLPDMNTLVHTIYETRMGGPLLDAGQLSALASWLAAIPDLPPPVASDPAAAIRGAQLFNDTAGANCVACHAGPRLTNHAIVDVHTGGSFKTPSLIGVGARSLLFHDGSIATLPDRFGPAGGGDQHGHTSTLTQGQIADLISYLQSL